MKEEKTLSDKMIFMKSADGELIPCIYYAHVMDFIKKLKEWKDQEDVIQIPEQDLDKLLGNRLI